MTGDAITVMADRICPLVLPTHSRDDVFIVFAESTRDSRTGNKHFERVVISGGKAQALARLRLIKNAMFTVKTDTRSGNTNCRRGSTRLLYTAAGIKC